MENTTGMQAHLIPCFEMRRIWEIPFCRKATLQISFQKGVLLMMEIFRSIILKITVFEDGRLQIKFYDGTEFYTQGICKVDVVYKHKEVPT